MGAKTTDAASAPHAAAIPGAAPKLFFADSYVPMNKAVPGTVPISSGTNPLYNWKQSAARNARPSGLTCILVLNVDSGNNNSCVVMPAIEPAAIPRFKCVGTVSTPALVDASRRLCADADVDRVAVDDGDRCVGRGLCFVDMVT